MAMRYLYHSIVVLGLLTSSCGQQKPSESEENSYSIQINKERKEKDQYLVTNGILDETYLEGFKGLKYFEVDSNYRIQAKIIPVQKIHKVLNTSTNEPRDYYIYCQLEIKVDGKVDTLEAYSSDTVRPNDLFIPFKDMTSGKESYAAGRFIELPYNGEMTSIELDFNLAFNPYCHYASNYSCPLVPQENILDLSIRAGEMKLHD